MIAYQNGVIEYTVFAVKCALVYHICAALLHLIWAILVHRVIPLFWTPNLDDYKNKWTRELTDSLSTISRQEDQPVTIQ